MAKQIFTVASALLIVMGMVTSVSADTVIWGNNAAGGNPYLEAFDVNTDTLVAQFLLPNQTARDSNGRGVAVLGNTIYYTTADSGNIYVTDVNTHADLGVLVNTGFAGIADVTTDGTYIYASDYQTNSGVVNKYDLTGKLVGTIAIGSGYQRDGFEVENNPNIDGGALTFISNRGDDKSPYDVYDSNGNLLISDFIDPSKNGFGTAQSGIAYDGTDYYVSQTLGNALLEYDGHGNFITEIDLSGIPNPNPRGRLLEDLSAVGNTINNPPPSVPEPTTTSLLGFGLAALAAIRRKMTSN